MNRKSSVLWLVLPLLLIAPRGAKAVIWYGGAKAGVNWSTVTGSDVPSTNYRSQIVAGGEFGAELSKYFALRLEGLFYPKGAEVVTEVQNGQSWLEVNGTLSLAYLEFPLLAVAQLPHGDRVFFQAFAGPYYAFNLQTSFDVAESGVTLPTGIDNLITDSDVGMVLGLAVAWDTTHFRTNLEGRYEFSVSSIDEQGLNAYNQTFAILIGFTPIRK